MIEDAATDPRFRDHPGREQYGIESYIAVPLHRPDGSLFGTLCTLDPQPRKLPDEQLETFELLASLIGQQLRSAEEREERERFMAALAHDLRNPLNAILVSSEVIDVAADKPALVRQTVARIVRSGQRMRIMIDELTDFARARIGGGFELDFERLDLAELARHTLHELEGLAEGIEVEASLHDELPVSGAPARLSQVLSNLIGNALTHGGGSPVSITGTRESDAVVVTIHNGGPAIPDELLSGLFKPFRRKSTSSGLGLGLYIASEIVQGHGGSIRVESHVESGTRFTVRLPAASD